MEIKLVNIVGAGSIGSFLILLLSKLKRYKIIVYDYDRVEAHNQRNQLYRRKDIKHFKIEALRDIVLKLSGSKISIRNIMIYDQSELHGPTIVAVDSMKSRKEIFNACKYRADIPIYVDARSGGDGAIIYALDPRDIDQVNRYEKTLYSDEGAIPAPCANEETLPILFTIASVIAKILINAESKLYLNFITQIINFEDLPIVMSKEEEPE